MAFDTTRLINQATLHGCLPTGRFLPQELLDIAYDVFLGEIVTEIIGIREEYYVRDDDQSIVAGTSEYLIPSRSTGGVLREVKLVDGTDVKDLKRKDLEDIDVISSGTPDSFYTKNNSLILDPVPLTSVGTLRQSYFIRPNKLVPVSECGAITAVNTGTRTVSLTIPTSWTTANTFDLVRGRAHYDILSIDLAASSVASGQIVFTTDLPAKLRVGDYVCLAEESCFPFLPPEGQMPLIMATAAAALASIGDPRAEATKTMADKFMANFKKLIGIRIQGAPKQFTTRVL